jgi:hypothetical protein
MKTRALFLALAVVAALALPARAGMSFPPVLVSAPVDCSAGIVDASGAGLVFTGVSCRKWQIQNTIYVAVQLTYPTTANASAAFVNGFPTFPNTGYGTTPAVAVSTSATAITVRGSGNTTIAYFTNASGNTQLTNVQLSTAVIQFLLSYAAQ